MNGSPLATLALEPVGWALVHLLWQGTAVAALLARLAPRGDRPADARGRHRLALAALAALALLPAVTTGLALAARAFGGGGGPVAAAAPEAAMGTEGAMPGAAAALESPPVTPLRPSSAGDRATRSDAAGVSSRAEPRTPAAGSSAPGGAAIASLPTRSDALMRSALAGLRGALPYLVVLWAAGALVVAGWRLAGWLWLRRLAAATTAAPRRVARALDEAARRLAAPLPDPPETAAGRPRPAGRRPALPEVAVCARLDGVAVVGRLRPRVLLAPAAAHRLRHDELVAVLAHELAHLEHRDPWVLAIQRGLETLLFFHPATRWIGRRLDAAREQRCDDRAAAACGTTVYVGALVRLAELGAGSAVRRRPGLAAAAGGLRARARRLLAPAETPRAPAGGGTPAASPVGARPPTAARPRELAGRGLAALAACAVIAAALGGRATAAAWQPPEPPQLARELLGGPPAPLWRVPLAAWVRRPLGGADPAAVLAGAPDPRLRERAALVLGLDGVTAPLIAGLADPDPGVRAKAAAGLALAPDRRALPDLAATLAADPEPAVRTACAAALGRLEDPRAIGPLAAALADPDPAVRAKAVGALAWIGGPVARQALAAALADPDPEVRAKAVRLGPGPSRAPGRGPVLAPSVRTPRSSVTPGDPDPDPDRDPGHRS